MNIVVLNIAQSRFKDSEVVSEFLHLVESNEYAVQYVSLAVVKKPSPSTYIHSGTLNHLRDVCQQLKPKYVICSIELQARYQRNLEKALCVSFLDRTELLLSLFEKRATSNAGKLQVELARLSYMQTKLVRGWTHLERQRGGIGLRGGPGETQIEVDRRILRENIHKTKVKLDKVVKTRSLNRQKRLNEHVFVIALVGYTNAGKSTLFNRLTESTTWANDQLFATLDPLVRTLKIPQIKRKILLVDTVGFMRDLPKPLLTAFHSTLEEINYSNLVLHVVDCSDIAMHDKMISVEDTLKAIQADEIPRINIFNKSDLNTSFSSEHSTDCTISTLNDDGVDDLCDQIRTFVQ